MGLVIQSDIQIANNVDMGPRTRIQPVDSHGFANSDAYFLDTLTFAIGVINQYMQKGKYQFSPSRYSKYAISPQFI